MDSDEIVFAEVKSVIGKTGKCLVPGLMMISAHFW